MVEEVLHEAVTPDFAGDRQSQFRLQIIGSSRRRW